MKMVKTALFLILFVFVLHYAYADIVIDSFSQDTYNLGDKVLVGGYVKTDGDTRANLFLDLICENSTNKISSVLVDTRDGEIQKFSQLVLVPNNVLGLCKINGKLVDDSTKIVLESGSAEAFSVTNKLKGTFNILKQNLQLGDVIRIEGSVNKYNDLPVDGLGIVAFYLDNNLSFQDSIDVKTGVFDYTKDASFMPPGKYNVEIIVYDNFGNSYKLDNNYEFDVSGNILAHASFDNKEYLPGENVVLNGVVAGTYKEILNDIELRFAFDDGSNSTKLLADKSSFNILHQTSKNIKSGDHTVKVYARADSGNYGFSLFNFSIKPLATSLIVKLNGNSFIPGDKIPFNLNLLDQANDLMGGSVTVSLLNGKKVLITNVFNANSDGIFVLPLELSPGKLTLRAESLGLTKESLIQILEYKKLDVDIVDGKLLLKNLGNVNYNNDLVVNANELTAKKALNIDVGKTKELDLGTMFDDGVYNVKVLDKNFDDVSVKAVGFFGNIGNGFSSISGNVAKNLGNSNRQIGLGFAILIIIGSVLFLFFKKKNGGENYFSDFSGKKYKEMRWKNDYDEGQKMADSLRRRGIRKDKPVQTYEFGKATEEDIEDFRQRMRKQVADEPQDKDDPKGGLMNMFG